MPTCPKLTIVKHTIDSMSAFELKREVEVTNNIAYLCPNNVSWELLHTQVLLFLYAGCELFLLCDVQRWMYTNVQFKPEQIFGTDR